MGLVDVIIYVGGKLCKYPEYWYKGGKRIICKDRDPDYMSMLELKRGIRYLGFRNHADIHMAFEEEGISTIYLVNDDPDLLTLLRKLGSRNKIYMFVSHQKDDFDDPLCDGHVDSYLINNLPDSWVEMENIYTNSEDVGSLGISPEEVVDVDSEFDNDYYPSASESDFESLFDESDAELEPTYLEELENEEAFDNIDEPNEPSEYERLDSPCDSDDEVGKKSSKFRFWNPMTDYESRIILEKDLVFHNVDEFKKCLVEYAIQEGFTYKMRPNEKHRVVAYCGSTVKCGWRLRASVCQITDGFRITSLSKEHACPRANSNWRASAKWIAEKIIRMVRADVDWKIEGIRNHLIEKYHIDIPKQKCYRAKLQALAIIHGEEKEQYFRVRDYCTALIAWNPGSSAIIHSPEGVFSRMYICLDACKRGFLEACRPLIAVDGCHLKTAFGGQLLCAIGKDPEDNMYPIAFAVVEIENGETWEWFFELLLKDLHGDEGKHYTFISDQQKGLVGALRKHVDAKHHRFCLRHLYGNFKVKFKGKVLKNLLWKAAISTTKKDFKGTMDEMKKVDEEAYKWLSQKDPVQWSKHGFPADAKCDMVMNNIAETFNAWVLNARTKPIRTMCEQIRWQLMKRYTAKRDALMTAAYRGKICPRIRARLNRLQKRHVDYIVNYDGELVHEVVHSSDRRFLVNISATTCSCRIWDLTGIPCVHAVAALLFQRLELEDYVHQFYHVKTFKKAYAPIVHVLPGPDEWRRGPEDDIQPPICRSQPGRRKKVRRREPDEEKTASKMQKSGVSKSCGSCGGTGHNTRSCQFSVTNPSRAAKARKEAIREKDYRERKKQGARKSSRPVRLCQQIKTGVSSSQPLPLQDYTATTSTGPRSSTQPATQNPSKLPSRRGARTASKN